MRESILCIGLAAAAATALAACSDGGENTGRSCKTADDCFVDIDHEEIAGEVECLDRVPGGYCTHTCETDADCCAVEGECTTEFPQVCAPFESTGVKRCFLSCEAEDIGDRGADDFCQRFAHSSFNCRSTGGGVMNRKVCVP